MGNRTNDNVAPSGGRSLISKSLIQYALCTAAVFVLMAPLFYLLTKYFYAEDMEDVLVSVRKGLAIPPIDLEEDIMAGMMLQFMLIFLVISFSLAITLRFVTSRLWQPFDDTLRKAEGFNIALDDIPEFTHSDVVEFERLNRTLERLMRKDAESYRIQKEFTENASHELQTPLAIIRTKTDLLMQENLDRRASRLVLDIDALVMRMSHITKNLLLLAKIENAQFTTEDVDLKELITTDLPLYNVLRPDVRLRLEDKRSDPSSRLRANEALLGCLMKNLIVNAIRHSPESGEVVITVDDTSLHVDNVSENGNPLDAASIFQRFHSGDSGHSDGDSPLDTGIRHGNGLGLSIVKAVCEFHGWSVDYSFRDPFHRFTVRFQKKAGGKRQ